MGSLKQYASGMIGILSNELFGQWTFIVFALSNHKAYKSVYLSRALHPYHAWTSVLRQRFTPYLVPTHLFRVPQNAKITPRVECTLRYVAYCCFYFTFTIFYSRSFWVCTSRYCTMSPVAMGILLCLRMKLTQLHECPTEFVNFITLGILSMPSTGYAALKLTAQCYWTIELHCTAATCHYPYPSTRYATREFEEWKPFY